VATGAAAWTAGILLENMLKAELRVWRRSILGSIEVSEPVGLVAFGPVRPHGFGIDMTVMGPFHWLRSSGGGGSLTEHFPACCIGTVSMPQATAEKLKTYNSACPGLQMKAIDLQVLRIAINITCTMHVTLPCSLDSVNCLSKGTLF
jgi:hypothetical protein